MQQGYIRLAYGFIEPLFFQEFRVFGMAHERKVRVQDDAEQSLFHLIFLISGPDCFLASRPVLRGRGSGRSSTLSSPGWIAGAAVRAAVYRASEPPRRASSGFRLRRRRTAARGAGDGSDRLSIRGRLRSLPAEARAGSESARPPR